MIMAGADNVTGPRTDVGTIQVDDGPPVDFPPYKGGANAAYEGANVTGYITGTPPPTNFLSDLDVRGDKAQAKIRTAAGYQARDDSYIGRQLRDDTEKHQKQMEESWNAERYAAHDPALRPWNADEEKAARVRGPMEQFGSVGFIFAMAASAFTRSPMTSALNAGAAAMTAIQEGDEKAYKSAYQAWKDNSDLALKRFDMEHRLYEDANQLLTTDMNLWKTKTSMIAAQFNDQTTLAMLDAGMYPQVVEMKEKLANSAIAVRKAQEGFQEFNGVTSLWTDSFKAWKEEHPKASQLEQYQAKMQFIDEAKKAYKGTLNQKLTPAQEFSQQWWAEHPDGTSEQFSEAFGKFVQGQKLPGGAHSGVVTEGRVRTAGIEDEIKEMKERGELKTKKEEDDYRAKRTGELKTAGAGITGNEQVKLKEKINQFKHFEEISNKVVQVINAHPMATGLPGKVMRVEERLANLVSAGYIKDSDRVQMMRDVRLLQVWANELLTSRNNKLKTAGEAMNDIVGGLNAGDTRDNTLASLRRLSGLFREMSAETQEILGGGAAPAAPAPVPSNKLPWADLPSKGRVGQ